jgi:hypothetical protein
MGVRTYLRIDEYDTVKHIYLFYTVLWKSVLSYVFDLYENANKSIIIHIFFLPHALSLPLSLSLSPYIHTPPTTTALTGS